MFSPIPSGPHRTEMKIIPVSPSVHRLIPKLGSLALACLLCASGYALGTERFVSFDPTAQDAALVAAGVAAPLFVESADWAGVQRAVRDLQADVERVSGVKPAVGDARGASAPFAVLVGTVGKSPLIDGLAKAGKLDVSGISGRWEAFQLQLVEKPLPGIGFSTS